MTCIIGLDRTFCAVTEKEVKILPVVYYDFVFKWPVVAWYHPVAQKQVILARYQLTPATYRRDGGHVKGIALSQYSNCADILKVSYHCYGYSSEPFKIIQTDTTIFDSE